MSTEKGTENDSIGEKERLQGTCGNRGGEGKNWGGEQFFYLLPTPGRAGNGGR